MQSPANSDELIDTARWELDAITDHIDANGQRADAAELAAEAKLYLDATREAPEGETTYLDEARTRLHQLVLSLDPDGPYYTYAKRAKTAIDQIN